LYILTQAATVSSLAAWMVKRGILNSNPVVKLDGRWVFVTSRSKAANPRYSPAGVVSQFSIYVEQSVAKEHGPLVPDTPIF
jgi:hypothetical protein